MNIPIDYQVPQHSHCMECGKVLAPGKCICIKCIIENGSQEERPHEDYYECVMEECVK